MSSLCINHNEDLPYAHQAHHRRELDDCLKDEREEEDKEGVDRARVWGCQTEGVCVEAGVGCVLNLTLTDIADRRI